MTCLKVKETKKDPRIPKSYDRNPKKYKETNSEVEETKSDVKEEPDKYDVKMDVNAIEHYGSSKDLFARAFSYGKRHRRH